MGQQVLHGAALRHLIGLAAAAPPSGAFEQVELLLMTLAKDDALAVTDFRRFKLARTVRDK